MLNTKGSIKKWNESHRAKTARKWLGDRGVLDSENLRFVSVDDPFCRYLVEIVG
jgi:hypothetical protein